MKTLHTSLFLVVSLLAAASAHAGSHPKHSDPLTVVTCASTTETRTLSIAPHGEGCRLMYEKKGHLNVAASAMEGLDHCKQARKKIRDNLRSNGWRCI